MKNRGFSLITLVITIIVMVTISAITILAVNSTDILSMRPEIEFKNDMKKFDIEIKSNTFSKASEFPAYAIYKKDEVEKYCFLLSKSQYITDDFDTTIAYIYQGVLTLKGKNITSEQRKWAREARIKIDDEGIIPQDKNIEIISSKAICTNENVILNFSYNGVMPQGYSIQYKVGENSSWIEGTSVSVDKNVTVYARLYNGVTKIEGVAASSIDITNIDKVSPTDPSIEVVNISDGNVSYKAYGSSDDDGIYCKCTDNAICQDNNCNSNSVGYQYSSNSYTWSSTYKENVNYNINTNNDDVVYMYARAIDCSSNISNVSSLRLYKIKYDVNGGNISNKPGDEYKVEGKNYTINNASQEKTGHIFAGWEDIKDNSIYTSGSKFTKDYTTTFRAKWDPKKVKVTFMRNISSSDTTSATQTFTYGVKGQSFSKKGWSKVGYTLIGWNVESGATTALHPETSGVSDSWILNKYPEITLYGVWSANTYTVTLDGNGGTVPVAKTSNVTYNSTYGNFLNNSATRTGYTFIGWYTSKTGGTKITSDTKVEITSDTTLYAHWQAKTVKVTFMRNISSSDTTSATQTFTYGVKGQTFSKKGWSKVGYTLIGWNVESGATTALHPETSVVSDSWILNKYPEITLYGVWSANTYTVTLDGNGGTVPVDKTSVTYNSTYGNFLNNSATRTGYTFLGWYTSKTGGTKITSDKKVEITSDTTLYAHWQPKTVKVKFMRNINSSDTTSATQTFTYGVSNQAFSDNGWKRDDYILLGWALDADASTQEWAAKCSVSDNWINSNSSKKEVTLYAVWTPSTITFTNGTQIKSNSTQSTGGNTMTTHAWVPAGVTITVNVHGGGYDNDDAQHGGISNFNIKFNGTEVKATGDYLTNLVYTTTSAGIIKLSITAGGNGSAEATIQSIKDAYGATYTLNSLSTSNETWSNGTGSSVTANANENKGYESSINVPKGVTIVCNASGGGRRWWFPVAVVSYLTDKPLVIMVEHLTNKIIVELLDTRLLKLEL